jgi:phosphatidylinositol glycan class O
MQRHVRAGSANTLKKADATDPSLFALRVFSLAQLCVLPLLLLWGPKSSVLLVCLWAIMLCVLSFRHEQATPPSARSSSGGSSLSEQSFLFFLSAHLFCCTGHSSSSFSSLQISAAFLGLEGFGFYASGALLALNTFGAQILGVLLVALLDALRRVQATSGSELTASAASSAAKKTKQHAVAITTVVPPPPPSSFPASLHLFSLLFLCRSVCSVLNVALQRRHLMVWAIFAPKFLFDAVAGVIVELAVMLVAAACTRWTTHSV